MKILVAFLFFSLFASFPSYAKPLNGSLNDRAKVLEQDKHKQYTDQIEELYNTFVLENRIDNFSYEYQIYLLEILKLIKQAEKKCNFSANKKTRFLVKEQIVCSQANKNIEFLIDRAILLYPEKNDTESDFI